MRNLLATTAVILLAAGPAMAQVPPSTREEPKSQADCAAQWRAADRNGDGRLDQAEIEAARSTVPTSIAGNPTINQQDFLNACSATVEGKKN